MMAALLEGVHGMEGEHGTTWHGIARHGRTNRSLLNVTSSRVETYHHNTVHSVGSLQIELKLGSVHGRARRARLVQLSAACQAGS